jgi:hypothetical protein
MSYRKQANARGFICPLTNDLCADGRCTVHNCAEEKDEDDLFRQKQAEALAPNIPAIGAKNTIGYLACSLIAQGLSTRAILDEVFKHFPNAQTTDKCIAWYRHDMKKHPAKYAELGLVYQPAR